MIDGMPIRVLSHADKNHNIRVMRCNCGKGRENHSENGVELSSYTGRWNWSISTRGDALSLRRLYDPLKETLCGSLRNTYRIGRNGRTLWSSNVPCNRGFSCDWLLDFLFATSHCSQEPFQDDFFAIFFERSSGALYAFGNRLRSFAKSLRAFADTAHGFFVLRLQDLCRACDVIACPGGEIYG